MNFAYSQNCYPVVIKPSVSANSALANDWMKLPEDQQFIKRLDLHSLGFSFERLHLLHDDWDGFGSRAPQADYIYAARALVESLWDESAQSSIPWRNPSVSVSEVGEVVLEWWAGERKLTVYVSEGEPLYVRVWGADIARDMDDGELREAGFINLWCWLHS